MASRYGSYCPVSLATETLGERWTILVVMTLIDGATRFSQMQRAMPRISPSVLTQRLRSLEDAGIVTKKRLRNGEGSGYDYALTRAGRELEPIIMELAFWGQRWARDMDPDDLDPWSLGWSMHLRMNTDAMPRGRIVLEFDLSGGTRKPSTFWIMHSEGVVDMCAQHPGHDADLRIVSDIRRFIEAWRGFRSLEEEIAAGRIKVSGPPRLKRAFPKWLLLSVASPAPRERPGRERTLSRHRARG